MRELKIIFLCFLVAIVSCRYKDLSQVSVDYPILIELDLSKAISDSMNLSEIAEKIEYIPLERTDQALLGYFYDVEITDKYFFVDFEKDLFRFGSDGKFMNRIYKKGRGPEEVQPVCSTVSSEDSLVYVMDWNKTIKVYNFSGEYISTITKSVNPVESLPPWRIGWFNNTLFVAVEQRPDTKYIYSCYDITTDTLYVLYQNNREYKNEQKNSRPAIIPYDFIYQITDSTILFKEKFSDTIFSAANTFKTIPKYITDLGKEKLIWEGWRDHAMFDFSNGLPSGYWVQSFTETDRFLLLLLVSHKGPQIFVTYNKKSGVTSLFTLKNFERAYTQVYLKNDIDNLIPFSPVNLDGYFTGYRSCLYAIIEGNEFAESYQKASEKAKNATRYLREKAPVFSKINEFSNPVIMKVYLK